MPSPAHTPTIVVASLNRSKSLEIEELLAPCGVSVVSVAQFDGVPGVVEDGETFAANAEKKAVQTARHLSMWAIGEDSGLTVDALEGEPGIYSARYGGPHATDEVNNAKLLQALDGVADDKRGARYVCSIAVSDPQGNVRAKAEGTCRGRISCEPHGTNGFGYDPLFLITEYHRTFGELSSVVKQQLSHRARAFRRLIPQLREVL